MEFDPFNPNYTTNTHLYGTSNITKYDIENNLLLSADFRSQLKTYIEITNDINMQISYDYSTKTPQEREYKKITEINKALKEQNIDIKSIVLQYLNLTKNNRWYCLDTSLGKYYLTNNTDHTTKTFTDKDIPGFAELMAEPNRDISKERELLNIPNDYLCFLADEFFACESVYRMCISMEVEISKGLLENVVHPPYIENYALYDEITNRLFSSNGRIELNKQYYITNGQQENGHPSVICIKITDVRKPDGGYASLTIEHLAMMQAIFSVARSNLREFTFKELHRLITKDPKAREPNKNIIIRYKELIEDLKRTEITIDYSHSYFIPTMMSDDIENADIENGPKFIILEEEPLLSLSKGTLKINGGVADGYVFKNSPFYDNSRTRTFPTFQYAFESNKYKKIQPLKKNSSHTRSNTLIKDYLIKTIDIKQRSSTKVKKNSKISLSINFETIEKSINMPVVTKGHPERTKPKFDKILNQLQEAGYIYAYEYKMESRKCVGIILYFYKV